MTSATALVLCWAVHDPTGIRVALLAYAEDAAGVVALYGEGATIRFGPLVVWREGKETQPAGESYDYVAEMVHARADARNREPLK